MGEPKLDKERHIKYWHRCLKTLLPTQYTSMDSSRMTLAFFILSALDLLGAGADTFPESERARVTDWILRCQHPNGGFCGSPNHKYPDVYYMDVGNGTEVMDPANLPATCFAILGLSVVGTLDKIERLECLRWLRTLQREDGSFGELVTQNGTIEGGRDMRYCYCATAIRWILRGDDELDESLRGIDIDVEKLVDHIRSGQTYDGGFSESSEHEAHAGYTYCAIAALSLLKHLPDSSSTSSVNTHHSNGKSNKSLAGFTDLPGTIRWLVSRQIPYSEGNDEDEEPVEREDLDQNRPIGTHEPSTSPEPPSLSYLSIDDSQFVGFNGRCNKLADTCYCFWAPASLDILGRGQLVNTNSTRRFLLEKTEHRIGGFGKTPGSPPDIYHSYLGLAALATMKDPALKDFDSTLCISTHARNNIDTLRKAA